MIQSVLKATGLHLPPYSQSLLVPSSDEGGAFEDDLDEPSPAKISRKSRTQNSRTRRREASRDRSKAISDAWDKCNLLANDISELLKAIKSTEETMGGLGTDHSDWETQPLKPLKDYELPTHGYYKRKLGSKPKHPGPERDKWQRDYRTSEKDRSAVRIENLKYLETVSLTLELQKKHMEKWLKLLQNLKFHNQ